MHLFSKFTGYQTFSSSSPYKLPNTQYCFIVSRNHSKAARIKVIGLRPSEAIQDFNFQDDVAKILNSFTSCFAEFVPNFVNLGRYFVLFQTLNT